MRTLERKLKLRFRTGRLLFKSASVIWVAQPLTSMNMGIRAAASDHARELREVELTVRIVSLLGGTHLLFDDQSGRSVWFGVAPGILRIVNFSLRVIG